MRSPASQERDKGAPAGSSACRDAWNVKAVGVGLTPGVGFSGVSGCSMGSLPSHPDKPSTAVMTRMIFKKVFISDERFSVEG